MKIIGALIILLSCVILGNGQNSVTYLEPNCGINQIPNIRSQGDNTADILEHPWMAYLSTTAACPQPSNSNCLYRCGGSLITTRYILSAAHCLFNQYTSAKLGTADISRPSSSAIDVPVEERIRHPDYAENDRNIKNDIALYRLARSVQYTVYIKPVCLATDMNLLEKTSSLTAAGWGKTEIGAVSDVLRTTTLMKQNRATCSSRYTTNVDMTQICAGTSYSNTCGGDSGGPITAKYSIEGTNRVIQLGIVSYGDCQAPTVYTNVWHYITWIASVVGRNIQQTTSIQNPWSPVSSQPIISYIYRAPTYESYVVNG